MPNRPSTSLWVWVAAAAMLAVFALQAGVAARRDSVTIDEFAHLPVGLYILYAGDFSLDPINPPLTRILAAVPVAARAPAFKVDPALGHWGMGFDLMRQNPGSYHELFVSARRVVIAIGVLLGLLVLVWARQLYGDAAGLTALFLYSFSPSMLTHAHLVTLDAAGAFGFVLTLYAAWWMLDRPGFAQAAAVGTALGLATLLKLSGFVLIAVIVLLVAIRVVSSAAGFDRGGVPLKGPVPIRRWVALLAVIGTVSLLVLNVGYSFQGSFASLSEARLADGGTLAVLRDAIPWLRLPLPLAFVNGVDMVLNVGKGHDPSYFLAGELSADGWWYYHLAAFALKTPLALLLAGCLAFVGWALGRSRGLRDYCLFVAVIVLFAANSLFNSLYIGVRHVLPAYPLLFIAVSPWLAAPIERLSGCAGAARATGGMRATGGVERAGHASATGRQILQAGAACVALAWVLLANLRVTPAFFESFNEIAGGPAHGHEWLVDSNLDWGQDLIRLKQVMDERGYERVNLAYFGRVHPSVYGVDFVPLESAAQTGPTAISASFLMGRPYFWYRQGRMRWVKSESYAWLREETPVARAGTMFIFER